MRRFVVGVVGAAVGADSGALDLAFRLGEKIAREGWAVLSGGRNVGVMQAVNAGAKQVPGSLTIGILPSATAEQSPDLDVVIVTDMHNARNNIIVISSDVVVACGQGGAGTASEIALALKAGKTVILLGADELSVQFFSRLGRERVQTAQTPEEVIGIIKKFAVPLKLNRDHH